MADHRYSGGEFFCRAESLRPDEDGLHAVRDRPGHVAGEVVADEQHLAGRASGSGQHKLVEQGRGLFDPQGVGEQGDAEQAVDPGLLEGGPSLLSGCCVRRNQESYPVLVQRAQCAGGCGVDRFLAEQVIDCVQGQGVAGL